MRASFVAKFCPLYSKLGNKSLSGYPFILGLNWKLSILFVHFATMILAQGWKIVEDFLENNCVSNLSGKL